MLVFSPGGFVVGGRAHDGDLVGNPFEGSEELVDVAKQRLDAIGPLAQGIRRDDPGRTADLGFAQARQIRLTKKPSPENPPTVPLRDVATEQAMPDERIDVKVDHLAREVELDGFFGNTELARPSA